MDHTEKKVFVYKYDDNYSVEIEESADDDSVIIWESWLIKKNYCHKSFMVGVQKEEWEKVHGTMDSFVDAVFSDIDTSISCYEQEIMMLEIDPDVVLDRPVDERFRDLFKRTLHNCEYYEEEQKEKHLLNEIGCLRGILYAMEKVGEAPIDDRTLHFIDKANDIFNADK